MHTTRWHAVLSRIQNIKNPIGAEIGVYRGQMSRELLKGHPGLKLYLVDAWSAHTYDDIGVEGGGARYPELYHNLAQENYNETLKNVSEFGSRAQIIKAWSLDAAKQFKNKFFDFVFIDASHDYKSVKADIRAWTPKIKKGGLICGHDYWGWEEVTKAVDEIFPVDKIETDIDFTYFIKI